MSQLKIIILKTVKILSFEKIVSVGIQFIAK